MAARWPMHSSVGVGWITRKSSTLSPGWSVSADGGKLFPTNAAFLPFFIAIISIIVQPIDLGLSKTPFHGNRANRV